MTASTTSSGDNILKSFLEGTSFPESEKIINNETLKLALELYGAYFTEFSMNAKFLTLMLALEALKLNISPTPITQNLINETKVKAQDLKKKTETDKSTSDDIESLEMLIKSLNNVCSKSIGEGIKHLVLTTLQENGDEEAEEKAKRIKEIYGDRGTLVHKGKLKSARLTSATSDAKEIVERILKVKFSQLAAG